jgi:hypothetical protein
LQQHNAIALTDIPFKCLASRREIGQERISPFALDSDRILVLEG